MEAGWRAVQVEEGRSKRAGRSEDERAEAEEAARRAAKEKRKKPGRREEPSFVI